MRVPLTKPTFNEKMYSEYCSYVRDILISGRLTLGKYLEKFEKMLKEFISSKYIVAMNSCTAALHAIMLALRIKNGDEVIIPTYTFASTVNAPLYVGAKPILVDSDPDTFNISEEAVKEKINSRTKAIIVVHISGHPADIKSFVDLAEDRNVYLIEDAAHALGSFYKNRHVGTFGIASAFSFYPSKIITTGEGGIVATNDDEIARKLKIIRCVGREGLGPTEVIELGHNFRMSELNAALGVVQMKLLRDLLNRRNEIAKFYDSKFRSIEYITPQKLLPGTTSSYYSYIIKLEDELRVSRDVIRNILYRKYGIETTIIYKPVHLHKFYRDLLNIKKGAFPVAEKLCETTLAIPIYGHMTLEEAEYVVKSLEEILSYYV